MMLNDIQSIQNPGLGAALIWKFSQGYAPKESALEGVPFLLAFIVLPLILHKGTRSNISATQAGLYKFEEKYHDKYDLLFAIHDRALAMRELSRKSISTGIATGLLTLVPAEGVIWPNDLPDPKNLPPSITALLKAAKKLGSWARQVSLFELTKTLHLDF
jgi:Family of unknown function (DUF6521)